MPDRTARPATRVNSLYATASDKTPRSLAGFVGPVVYAARLADGVIKIGHTADIYNRLKVYGGLRSALALVPGTYEDEQAIHASLTAHRARGREYYHPTPEVLAVVNQMRAANRLDPVTA